VGDYSVVDLRKTVEFLINMPGGLEGIKGTAFSCQL
jgi:hypothetical protein